MILSNTMVTILDTKSNSMHNLSIDEIIPVFSLDAKFINYDNIVNGELVSANLDPNKGIMIKDLDGWTSLLSIFKYKKSYSSNMKCFMINDEIIVSNEFIPVYYPNDYRIGFHGSTLYKYDLRDISDVGNKAILRKHMDEFEEVSISEIDCSEEIGYSLITKSGFCNLGKHDGYSFHAGVSQKIGYH